jgi:hypothetical protein
MPQNGRNRVELSKLRHWDGAHVKARHDKGELNDKAELS